MLVEVDSRKKIVEVDMATQVIEFGRSMGFTFKEFPHSGVIEARVTDGVFIYEPFDNQPIIKEAEKRLFAVGLRFPIAEIIWGDEIVKPVPEIEWEQVRKVATGVLSAVVIVGGLAVAGAIAALTHADPCLLVVLNNDKKTWIQICSWL